MTTPLRTSAAGVDSAPAALPLEGLPLTLLVGGREVLVVGAGPVSARRAAAFAEAGAQLTVVAPEVSDAMAEVLAAASDSGVRVVLRRRPFEPADLDTPWLVHVATGRPEVDAEVAAECEQRRLFCIAAGQATSGSARVPARTGIDTPAGPVRIAVDSGDPKRSATVGRHVAQTLAAGESGLPDLRARRSRAAGWVAVVGGSSAAGDGDLLTVRGRRLLHAADVLVTDAPVDPELTRELAPEVEIIELTGPIDAATAAVIRRREAAGRGVVRIVAAGRLAAEAAQLRAAGTEPAVVPGVVPELP